MQSSIVIGCLLAVAVFCDESTVAPIATNAPTTVQIKETTEVIPQETTKLSTILGTSPKFDVTTPVVATSAKTVTEEAIGTTGAVPVKASTEAVTNPAKSETEAATSPAKSETEAVTKPAESSTEGVTNPAKATVEVSTVAPDVTTTTTPKAPTQGSTTESDFTSTDGSTEAPPPTTTTKSSRSTILATASVLVACLYVL